MSEQKAKNVVLVFGGTYDPPHVGHMRAVLEAQYRLNASCVKLVPCFIPAHKDAPSISARERAFMLQLAAEELNRAFGSETLFEVDDRELNRDKPSYSYDTLLSLRQEKPDASLVWMVGMDSYNAINTWHRWQELSTLAHLLIVTRPGEQKTQEGEIAEFFDSKLASQEALSVNKAGLIHFLSVSGLDVSSTELRRKLKAKEPVDYLVPPSVLDYINQHSFYV